MNVECRMNVFCLFYKKRMSKAKPPFDIQRFDIRYSAVRFSMVLQAIDHVFRAIPPSVMWRII